MSLHEGAKTRVRVDSELSEEVEVKAWVNQGSVLLPLLFADVVDVVTELAREGVQNELLYADDSVLMSETIDNVFYNTGHPGAKYNEISKNLVLHLRPTHLL